MRLGSVVVVALTTALTVAPQAVGARAAPAAGSASVGTAVVGTGTFGVGATASRVSVLAYRSGTGSVLGGYRVRSSGGTTTVVATCLRVDGDRALVGGIVVQSPVPGEVGTGASLAIDDRGFRGLPALDRLSLGTASTCPFSPAAIAGPWDVLVRGDYFVFGAPTG